MHHTKRIAGRLLSLLLALLLATQGLSVLADDLPEEAVPETKAAIEVTPSDINPFGDVTEGTFYYSPVLWAV